MMHFRPPTFLLLYVKHGMPQCPFFWASALDQLNIQLNVEKVVVPKGEL